MTQILQNLGSFLGWLFFAGGTFGLLYIVALIWVANEKDKP